VSFGRAGTIRHKAEIVAYRRAAFTNKSWQLPGDWRNINCVDLYRITLEGCMPMKQRISVTDLKLAFSLDKAEGIPIVPAGTWISGKVIK
jgi:hypothetical protein